MIRKAILGIMLILMLSCISTLSSSSQTASVFATVIFEDDFESYAVGTFPYAGGWELWTNGAGDAYQVIVDSVSVSPSKSLQLRGYPNWIATASKRYTTDSIRLGFEVFVRAEESGGARVGFTKRVAPNLIRFYSAVGFLSNGEIVLRGYGELEPWAPGEWYKITQVIDRLNDTCSVWVNDVLRASDVGLETNDVPGEYHYNETEAFTLASSYEIINAYFDDVKIFQYGPPTPTYVFFNINPNPATVGQTVTLKGMLTDEFSQPLSNKAVELYARPLAKSWRHVASLTTNDYGTFTWQATIPLQGIFIFAVYYPGSKMYESTYNLAVLLVQ